MSDIFKIKNYERFLVKAKPLLIEKLVNTLLFDASRALPKFAWLFSPK